MKRLLLGALVATAFLAGAGPAAATTQCGDGGHWCVGVQHQHGHIVLVFAGFGYKGTYQACVTPPKSKEVCKSFGLTPNATGANQSTVLFTKHFPHRRKGKYHARWVYAGKQVGSTMTFSP